MNNSAMLYLELLKRCLTNFIYDDALDLLRGEFAVDPATGRYVNIRPSPVTPEGKYYGDIWPSRAHTMIGIPRLNNIQYCVEHVLRHNVVGDLIETGVWRGGASIFMRGILKATTSSTGGLGCGLVRRATSCRSRQVSTRNRFEPRPGAGISGFAR